MDPHLYINGQRLTYSELNHFLPSSPFEKSAVSFIKEWRSGAPDFKMYTSGSTGVPKLIKIKRSQMEASAKFTIRALSLQPGQNALVCLDTKYIAGKMMLVRALLNQMNIILREPSANPMLNLGVQPDFAALVPLQLEEAAANSATCDILNKMAAIIVGGAPVNISLEERLRHIKPPVYATYGMTETVSHIALKRLNGEKRSNYYEAFDEVILDTDERGCLAVTSVLTDYQTIITNDRVFLHDAHHFEWLGRIDNVINSGGIKVQSERVERAIEQLFNKFKITNRFFVTGMPDNKLGQRVTIVIESVKPIGQARDLMSELQNMLDKFECPKGILYLPKFVETATGKVNRHLTTGQAMRVR
ncbi:O-succinylbenzoic acid--CoA ligase [Fulvivirga imtechensis AK7]|uniref:O-succinylbenzoic acid--CoA ligase n=1 Tax=Fulvivirga imtechensis AK7 TaxID=1237149 RepID=L8JW53_9BACT|nr:AMP-binding protein [Fulvivirga imtechensis]ELR73246.1 O-succinylbenzoic acid--CoA ligase [Fulvivirga imtechensis AK7]